MKANHPPEILRAYIRSQEIAQKADLFRLAYLSVKGGFYVDADDRSLAPIYSFVSPAAHFVTYQEDYGTLGNNFLGAKPNHPAIGLALKLGAEAINRGDHDLLWLSTGPALLTRAFAQLIADPALSFSSHWIPLLSLIWASYRSTWACIARHSTRKHKSIGNVPRSESDPRIYLRPFHESNDKV